MTDRDFKRLLRRISKPELPSSKQTQMFKNLMIKTNSVESPSFCDLLQTSHFGHLDFHFSICFAFRIS